MNNEIPSYASWRDRGDNIGIQCLKCFRIHWTFDSPPTDPTTGQPCHNCMLIKSGNYIVKETAKHAEELKAYNANLVKGAKPEELEPFTCIHEESQ